MAVSVKNPREISLMRESGKRLAEVHERLAEILKPGISTQEITEFGEEWIIKLGGIPNFKDYQGYPAAVCVSLNDEVVHGIPKKDRILKDGDLVSLDTGMIYGGYHSDAARSYVLGNDKEKEQLVADTKESFFRGIEKAVAGEHLHSISKAIDEYLTERGYGVVRDLTGHGIGKKLHEDPPIPNFTQPKRGIRLEAGMTLAIEPMVNLGTWEVEFSKEDGWTVTTKDHSPSAHYENTILITDGKPEILTLA